MGDFLIAKRDKAPAYQLAVVVDDHAQGVTEVLRGADLLPSAARQWHVQKALGLAHPAWFHVPLVTDASGRRLAKREADLSLAELRAGGTDPRAIVAWAARSAGLAVGERVTPPEVTPTLSARRLAPGLRGARAGALGGTQGCALRTPAAGSLLQQTALRIQRDEQRFFAARRDFMVFRQGAHEPGVRAVGVTSDSDAHG